ncbi:MAG TPA: TSUP family transporter, partial [Thermoanaerobaculia bacterium]|nr:TSUP family transporter [Thermoanaerobaculia bacterium]
VRSAALLAFNISKESFVATAMALAIAVDLARIPVYVSVHHDAMAHAWRTVLLATAGVLAGTLWGNRILKSVPLVPFRRTVACLVFVLGVSVLVSALRSGI